MANSENPGISDQSLLRDVQYRDSSKLKARANIHKCGRSPIGWFEWIAREAALPEGAEVLDVGCGPGWLWAQDNGQFPSSSSVTLVDLSDGMVAEALERVRGLARYRGVAGRTADAVALPFADGSFDAVLACHMLYHVPDQDRAIDEMVRVLRPGGKLVVTTNGDDDMIEMYRLAHAAFGGPDRNPSAIAVDLAKAEAMLRARLDDVEAVILRDELPVTDGEDIVGTLRSYPPGDGADDAQIEALRSMIAARMAEDGGVFRINKRTGLVRGRKR
ncbi:MAG: class I SAM-dependent methyltransferase [Devosia sp.]|nr:class I SAM-dependent methyltransferase [Devosia sp.]